MTITETKTIFQLLPSKHILVHVVNISHLPCTDDKAPLVTMIRGELIHGILHIHSQGEASLRVDSRIWVNVVLHICLEKTAIWVFVFMFMKADIWTSFPLYFTLYIENYYIFFYTDITIFASFTWHIHCTILPRI